MLVLARFSLALSLGLARGISNAHSSYWLVLSARFTGATSRDLCYCFVTRLIDYIMDRNDPRKLASSTYKTLKHIVLLNMSTKT